MIYGYARVSTEAQDLTGSTAQLKAASCEKIYREKITGTTADRPQLKKLVAALALNAHRNGPTFAHENGPSLCAGLYGAEIVTSSSARVTRTLQPLPDGEAAPGPSAPPIEEQPVQMGLPIAAEPSAARWGGRYSRADR